MSLLTETATAAETILKSGKIAPFSGVLVGEKQYRKYVSDEFEIRNLREHNQMLITQMDGLLMRETEAKRSEPNVWTWLMAGIILGAAGTYSAVK